MASGDGVITRQEIITDEALAFGKEYRKNVDEAIKANDELINQFKTLLKITSEYRKAQNTGDYREQKAKEQKVNQEILNLIKEIEQAERALERIKQEKLRTEKEMYKVAQENVKLSKMQNQAQRQNKTLTMEERVQQQLKNQTDKQAVLEKMGLIGAYQKLNKQRTESKKRLQDLIATGTASNAQIRQAQKEFDVLDQKVKKADRAVGDFTKNVGNYKSALSGVSNLLGAFGFVGGITGAVMLGKSIYQTTKEIQAQEIALKMLSETESVYVKNKDFLTRITEQYGLELMTTTNAYKNFFASAKTSIEEGKLSFNEMQLIFEKVSKSSSTLGLSIEQQEGAFLALSQMLSKGTVQSEELRGQLGERLPGAFEVMAKALNVSTMELGKMLQNGEVLASDVLPKFAIAYEKAIGADQIERVETLAAAENRASNKWTDFVDNLNKGQGVISQVGMSFFNLTSDILDLIGAKEKLSEELENEQLQLNILIGKITSANIKEEERLSLINELKRNYPDFISFIKDEDFSNQNLIKTLQKINNEYRERIRLQVQNEKIAGLVKERDDKFTIAEKSRYDLMERLIKLNNKYQLGFEITRDNAVEMSDAVIKSLEKVEDKLKFGDAVGYLTGNQRIKTLADRVEVFEKSVEKANEELQKQQAVYDEINDSEENKEHSMRTQLALLKEYNTDLFKARQEAEKLGGVVSKDFDPFNIDSINSFISNKSKGIESNGESKKAKAAREKAQREAEKREDARLKKLKESYEAEIDLKIWRSDNLAEINKAESTNEKNTQEERYNALLAYQKAEEESLRLNVEKQLTLSRLFQKDKKAFSEQEISDMLNNISVKADVTDQELLILEKFYAAQEKLRKDNQKKLEENVKFEANKLKNDAIKASNKIQFDNDKDAEKDISALNIGDNLVDVERYEKAVYDIKRKYLLKTLEAQLKYYDDLVEKEKENGTISEDILKEQLNLQKSVRDFNNQTHVESLDKAKELERRFIEMGENIKNALVDLTNAIFDNRIQRIDEDIERSDAYFQKQIELHEGDADVQKAYREEQEKAREKLEAKKRKEQQKQAIFNKAMAISDIGWNTAKAIMSAMADFPGPIGIALAIGAGIAGAIQTAAVLASPIPKYRTGRKGGPEELAIVGDGGVHEVIEHKDGSAEITPNRDTLVKLLEGDTVHASLDLYRKSRENKINNDLYKHQVKFDAYNSVVSNDTSKIEEKLDTLTDVLKKKNLSTVVNVPKYDFAHQLWVEKQRNW